MTKQLRNIKKPEPVYWLTEAEHALIYTWFDEGKSIQEIASEMEIEENRVHKSIVRTRRRVWATLPVEEILARNGILADMVDEKLVLAMSGNDVQTKDLIAIKDMLFKQNQLLEWRSTENTAIQIEWKS